MARNGSGVYSLPAGSTIANGDLSDASDLNTPLSDIETDLNTPRPIVAGGTGASSASAARTALGLAIGTDVQAYSAGLASWAGVTRASGFDTFAATPSSANLRALLSDEVGTGAAYFVGGALGTPASGVLTNCTGLTTSGIAAATLVTASEGISSNNNDTTIPTSAAVKAYADSIGADIFFRLNSAHAGADSTSAQNLFPQAVTLEANTVYEYEIFWSISKTAGATSHTLSTGFGGTATLNNIQRNFAFNGSTTLTYAASFTSAGYLLTANSTLFANAVANATVNYWNSERGTVSINGAGTFIPQYTLSAAPGGAYSTNIGSYFRLRRLGASGSNLSSGSWA